MVVEDSPKVEDAWERSVLVAEGAVEDQHNVGTGAEKCPDHPGRSLPTTPDKSAWPPRDIKKPQTLGMCRELGLCFLLDQVCGGAWWTIQGLNL
jgi:hypothetical protein